MDDLFSFDMPNKINENVIVTDNDIKKFINLDTVKLFNKIKMQSEQLKTSDLEGGTINKVEKVIINKFNLGNNNTLQIFKTEY
jgi:hypothetical protein